MVSTSRLIVRREEEGGVPLVSRRAASCVCGCTRLYIPAIIACWSDVTS